MRRLLLLGLLLAPFSAFAQKTSQPPGIPYTSPPQDLQQFWNPVGGPGGTGAYFYWPVSSSGVPQVGGTVTINQTTPGTTNGVTPVPIYGTPTNSGAVAIGTTATNVGSPATTAHYIIAQVQGTAPVCLTFSTSTLTAPTTTMCPVGDFLSPGQSVTYYASSGAMPSSQLKAIALAAGTSWVTEDVQ